MERTSSFPCINNIFKFYLNREVKPTETNDINNTQQSGDEYGRAVRS